MIIIQIEWQTLNVLTLSYPISQFFNHICLTVREWELWIWQILKSILQWSWFLLITYITSWLVELIISWTTLMISWSLIFLMEMKQTISSSAYFGSPWNILTLLWYEDILLQLMLYMPLSPCILVQNIRQYKINKSVNISIDQSVYSV